MAVTESVHFVFDESWVDFANKRLLPWAFTPRLKEKGRLVLSTCEDRNIREAEVWEMGERLRTRIQEARRKKQNHKSDVKLIGRSDMKATSYESKELDFEPKELPDLPEHVNVFGWEQAAITFETNHEQLALLISLESHFIPMVPGVSETVRSGE